MLLLVSGATKYPRSPTVGHLIVPRQWADPDSLDLSHGWAMDNGCFNGLDAGAYMRMLYAYRKKTGCLFVTVPDAVGDAAETRYLWKWWAPIVRAAGHTPAFVAQDGLHPNQVPWPDSNNNPIALFIGGTDEATGKITLAKSLMGMAKARGIWVHVGRVNGQRRYEMMLTAGADSIDGSGFSMYPDTNIPLVQDWRDRIAAQPELCLD